MTEVIYAYTRAQAIADGVLVDVTETANQVGIALPTAVTLAVWERFIANELWLCCADEYGRSRTVLWHLSRAIEQQPEASEVRFEVPVRQPDQRLQCCPLKAHCGPGDKGEPVITVMLPEED